MADDAGSDPLVGELREQITDTDLAILAAFNRRLDLVRRLKQHKAERGYAFLDKGREDALFAELQQANGGPISLEGLRRLHAELLDLTKRELGGG
jgi:chorismate mutase